MAKAYHYHGHGIRGPLVYRPTDAYVCPNLDCAQQGWMMVVVYAGQPPHRTVCRLCGTRLVLREETER